MNLAGQLPKTFGTASLPTFDPDIKRMYNVETSLSIQHEILPGVSVTGGWYNRQYHNMWRRTNTGVGFSDFTPFTVFSPIDGTPITYYNVSAAKVAQLGTNLVDTNAPDRTDKYNGYEYNFSLPPAARHHDVRRRHDRTDALELVRRQLESEPAPLLRSEHRPVCRSGRSSRSPDRFRSLTASRWACRSRACPVISTARRRSAR